MFFRLFDADGAAVTAARPIEGEDLDHPISSYAFAAQDVGVSIVYENGAPFVLDLDRYQRVVTTEALVRVDFDAQGREISLAADFGGIEDVAVLEDATVAVLQRQDLRDTAGDLVGDA